MDGASLLDFQAPYCDFYYKKKLMVAIGMVNHWQTDAKYVNDKYRNTLVFYCLGRNS
jgi:hypothetical protein